MTSDQRADLDYLLQLPQFTRFLWRVIQMARILQPTANGSDGRSLDYHEGRRNLGFEILHEVEQAQAAPHEDSLMTIFQALREEAQRPTTEKPNGRRYDRNAELGNDADDD